VSKLLIEALPEPIVGWGWQGTNNHIFSYGLESGTICILMKKIMRYDWLAFFSI